MAKRTDRALGLWILGSFLVGSLVGFGIFWFMPGSGVFWWIMLVIASVMLGILAALIVFGRRAQRAMYAQMEGTLGATTGALQMLRKSWKVQPAVGLNKNQDMVHRVIRPTWHRVGRRRLKQLARQGAACQRTQASRAGARRCPGARGDRGQQQGEVPIPKLVKAVQGFPRAIEPKQMTEILSKLKAIDAVRGAVPMPKGPMPTSMKRARAAACAAADLLRQHLARRRRLDVDRLAEVVEVENHLG